MEKVDEFAGALSRLSVAERDDIAAGGSAISRLHKNARLTLDDHIAAGCGLQTLQEAAMHLSGANSPHGAVYSRAYAALVKDASEYDGIDRAYANRARWLWANRDAVREWWKNTLSPTEQMTINHPQAVQKHYEDHLKKLEAGDDDEDEDGAKANKPKKPSAADLQRELLQREIEGLKAYIAELEGVNGKLEAENKDLAARNEELAHEIADLDTDNIRLTNDNTALLDRIREFKGRHPSPPTTGEADAEPAAKTNGRKGKAPDEIGRILQNLQPGQSILIRDKTAMQLRAQVQYWQRKRGVTMHAYTTNDGLEVSVE